MSCVLTCVLTCVRFRYVVSCAPRLPPNGKVTWTNITVEVNGNVVQNPVFVAKEEDPACNSKAVVVDSSTVSITWGGNGKSGGKPAQKVV